MKIIDRYVLGMFIRNYLISFMVLIGMYIALDMVFNFANLTQNKNTSLGEISLWQVLYDIGDFYFYEGFVYFVQLSGMIAVLAAAFTVMRLSRFNEMTALLAAGTPLLRVAMPVILAGVAVNLVLLPIDQEIVIPHMIHKLMREHGEVHQANVRTFPVRMQDRYSSLFLASVYWPPQIATDSQPAAPAHLEIMDVIQRDENLRPIAHLSAKSAVWDAAGSQWNLTDGLLVPIAGKFFPPRTVASYQSDITPEEIALNNLGKDYIQLLPTLKINQLLDPSRQKSYGTLDLLRTKHLRFTQPIANVILLLLTIAMVLTREPSTLKSAALKCMLVTTLCSASVFLSHQLAGAPPGRSMLNIWPALMAWLPIFIFGPLAAYYLDHVKS